MNEEEHDVSLDETLDDDSIVHEVEHTLDVKSHLEPDSLEACGYCGQFFGPETIAVERQLYGRQWRFCDESCLAEFLEHSNFKDENLDGEPEKNVAIDLEEEES